MIYEFYGVLSDKGYLMCIQFYLIRQSNIYSEDLLGTYERKTHSGPDPRFHELPVN